MRVVLFTKMGQVLKLETKDLPLQSRGIGMNKMTVRQKDEIVAVIPESSTIDLDACKLLMNPRIFAWTKKVAKLRSK